MTARTDILEAIERIEHRSGRDTFTILEVLDDLRRRGTRYAESTIRTHIGCHMCANAGHHHPVAHPDLERVDRGLYRRLQRAPTTAPSSTPPPALSSSSAERITEDEVKRAVAAHLEAQGYTVQVAWGGTRGIDIDARRGSERIVLEAKAEVALQPQQVNYFLNVLGELVQRMDDPEARYGLALPDNRQYRGLVGRLPAYARDRLRLLVFFARQEGDGYGIEVVGT
jgi:hypothetical protein